MNFKELQSFIAISKFKNFSKAADSLYITQPTISHHIQTLEDELNATILSRSSKNVSLTKAGKILLIHAQKILNEKEQIHYLFEKYNDDISGVLEIATSTIPAQYYLPDQINNFSKIHSSMKFKIEKLDTAGVHKKLEDSEIDFGIVGAKSIQSHFAYEKIMDDEIVLCCSSELAIADNISLRDVIKLPLIIREDGSATRKHVLSKLKEASISFNDLNIFAEIDDINTIKNCLLKSDKFTFTSKMAIKDELERNQLKIVSIVDFHIKREFYFVYNVKHILTPLSKAFKEFIMNAEKEEN